MSDRHNKRSSRLSERANKLIQSYAFGSSFLGYLPFPVVDAFGIMAIQRRMLFHLAKVYDVPFSRGLAKDLLKTLVGGVLSRAAIPMAIKIIPGIGALFGSAGMATFGGASTYATGKVFQHHFERGGTLEDFDPNKAEKEFEEELKKGIKLSREKEKKAR